MAERTWKIRDQMPDGSWGPEREVTLAQYMAEVRAKSAAAMAVFKGNAAKIRAEEAA